MIHDFEIALGGATSEDVDAALGPGRSAWPRRPASDLNAAINAGVARGLGLGQAVARWLSDRRPPHARRERAARGRALEIPVTVHVAIGTDIIHMHPRASGAAIGEGSLRDFRYFTSSVARLTGGVYLNCGSAVMLPEVFLKAVALARNRGVSLDGPDHGQPRLHPSLPAADQRGAAAHPRRRAAAYSLVGHHEILHPAARGGAEGLKRAEAGRSSPASSRWLELEAELIYNARLRFARAAGVGERRCRSSSAG